MNKQSDIITSEAYYQFLVKSGIDFAAGVPCSAVGSLIKKMECSTSIKYIPAPREDIAVSLAFGYGLATQKLPLVIMQNSGIGTSLDALITEPILYKIPILLIVSWRGFYKKGIDEIGDEPQHWLWGDVTRSLLENIGVTCFELDSMNKLELTRNAIEHSKASGEVSALLLKRNGSIYENR